MEAMRTARLRLRRHKPKLQVIDEGGHWRKGHIMLSYRCSSLIINQLHFVKLSIITGSPRRIKWNR